MGKSILSKIDELFSSTSPDDVGYMITVLGCVLDGDLEYAKKLISLYALSQK